MTDAVFTSHGAPDAAPLPANPVAGRVRIEGEVKQALETGRNRLIVTGALFALAFTAISARLFDVTLIGRGAEPRVATAPRLGALETFRADITDRNGVLLATSLETASLYANARQVPDAADAAGKLAGVLGGDQADLAAKLGSGKSFVWIRRNLTPRQQYEVNRLGIPGLDFQRDERRVYPLGNIAAHIVGFTDIDNKGLAGIERRFDEQLRGAQHPVKLALDVRVQHVLRAELESAMRDFSAVGAAGMVLDARTGEILSMVSLPDFDPHRPGAVDPDARFNRPTLGVYEMGSTFKLFTLALGLDSGVATLNSTWDATYPIHISRFTIKDYRGGERRWLSTSEVLQYSSNIGAARMGVAAGPARQRDFMKRMGMLDTPRIELPETGQPMFPTNWREINTMTISFGHGLAVSPLQLANGVAALVNGGVLRPATLLKRDPSDIPPGTQVIKPETSKVMRGLMRMVVEKGTGKKANIPGYRVGGKTGTAEKVSAHGGYARKALLSSFVGAFPIDDPRYVVLAMLDEPHGTRQTGGFATGGAVAAPTIGKIVARIGPLLAVDPVDLPPRPAQPLLNARAQGKSVAAN
ncbi:MAG: penicillin-binding protein 2 [Alphaproteobacteria bacterium]|nr:penicillin-binding protein 2 [Alphaproteobacteria bacterium]